MSMIIASHVALACEAPLVTEEYYAKHFGFRRARLISLGADNQIVFLKMQDCAFYLELFQAKEPRTAPARTGDGLWSPGVRHLAFKVDDVDKKLKDMGAAAKVTLGPMSFDTFISGWRSVWLADPDGNIIELSQNYADQ
jgi:glyoxylase I family protein